MSEKGFAGNNGESLWRKAIKRLCAMMEVHLSGGSGYEPLFRRLFHPQGFSTRRGLHSLMILSAPLHPSLIDFSSKYFYWGQQVHFSCNFRNWKSYPPKIQVVSSCWADWVTKVFVKFFVVHANSLGRVQGCRVTCVQGYRGAGLHREGGTA